MSFKIIYEPSGRAKEYADLALNIYNSCNFSCAYCYVPRVLKKDRQEFHTIMKARDSLLQKVEHDCQLNLFEGRKVLLCFTCDPYQDINEDLHLTRKVMEIFNRYGVNWIVLTKGGMRASRDFDLYKTGDSFGCTLTFINDKDSINWEPGAALPWDRLTVLDYAHNSAIKTWVSMEPVIDPKQTLHLIQLTRDFVDLYKVGKLNSLNSAGSERYEELRQIEQTIDWKDFGERAEAMLKGYGKEYYIKEDLRREMKKNEVF